MKLKNKIIVVFSLVCLLVPTHSTGSEPKREEVVEIKEKKSTPKKIPPQELGFLMSWWKGERAIRKEAETTIKKMIEETDTLADLLWAISDARNMITDIATKTLKKKLNATLMRKKLMDFLSDTTSNQASKILDKIKEMAELMTRSLDVFLDVARRTEVKANEEILEKLSAKKRLLVKYLNLLQSFLEKKEKPFLQFMGKSILKEKIWTQAKNIQKSISKNANDKKEMTKNAIEKNSAEQKEKTARIKQLKQLMMEQEPAEGKPLSFHQFWAKRERATIIEKSADEIKKLINEAETFFDMRWAMQEARHIIDGMEPVTIKEKFGYQTKFDYQNMKSELETILIKETTNQAEKITKTIEKMTDLLIDSFSATADLMHRSNQQLKMEVGLSKYDGMPTDERQEYVNDINVGKQYVVFYLEQIENFADHGIESLTKTLQKQIIRKSTEAYSKISARITKIIKKELTEKEQQRLKHTKKSLEPLEEIGNIILPTRHDDSTPTIEEMKKEKIEQEKFKKFLIKKKLKEKHEKELEKIKKSRDEFKKKQEAKKWNH